VNVSRQHLQILDTVRAAVCQRHDVIDMVSNKRCDSEKISKLLGYATLTERHPYHSATF
jgi:hypothetical protein